MILSIKPKYAERILSGEKKCEFRKSSFPRHIKTAIIYESKPVGKIVGWFNISKHETGRPMDIWKKHSKIGGITKKEFTEYYSGYKEAVCLKIDRVHRLDSPIDPFESNLDFVIPQSFRYVNNEDYNLLISRIPDFSGQKSITDRFEDIQTNIK